MESLINRTDIFSFFLILSLFFLFISINLIISKKFNIEYYKTSILGLLTMFFIIIGGRFFTFELKDWDVFINSGVLPENKKITVIGAIVFGTLGFLLCKKLLGIKYFLLDSLAIPVLLTMAIQRLGCLFAGCCSGIITYSDLGIQYSPYTSAHYFCFKNGTLANHESYTLPLHPVPLYLICICIFSAIIVYFVKNKFKGKGNLFLLSLSLFIIGRFLTEFVREPLSEGIVGNYWFGLKILQWILLCATIFLGFIIYYREKFVGLKKISTNKLKEKADYLSPFKGLLILILTLMILLISINFFTKPEFNALLMFLSLSGIHLLLEIAKKSSKFYSSLPKIATIAFVLIFLPITAQVSFENLKDITKYNADVSVGKSSFSFNHRHEQYSWTTRTYIDCNGNPDTIIGYNNPEVIRHNIHVQAFGLKLNNKIAKDKEVYLYLNYIFGYDKYDNNNNNPTIMDGLTKEYYYNFEPGIGYNGKYFGFESKINYGRIRKPDLYDSIKKEPLSAGKPSIIMSYPAFSIRIGELKEAFVDIRAGSSRYGLNSMYYPILIGIGTGFRKNDNSILRINYGSYQSRYKFNHTLEIYAGKKYRDFKTDINIVFPFSIIGAGPYFSISAQYTIHGDWLRKNFF